MKIIVLKKIIFCIVGPLNYTRFFPNYFWEESQRSKHCKKKIKILCPIECKSGSRCNSDQDCPKGQCKTINYFDIERSCVCDKDCKHGSICYPDLQDAEPCDGNGRCKQVGMYKHICECGEGNNIEI